MRALIAALQLARVIAGEAGACPVEAKVAIAHVHANRIEAGIAGGWFGDDDPAADDLAVALVWSTLPDPSDGALFAIGPGDLARVRWFVGEVTARWECGSADFVETRR